MKTKRNARLLMVASLAAAVMLLTGLFVTFGAPPNNGYLVEYGPVHSNYGFPTWYKDVNGLALELCLDPTYCAFVPGDIPDPTSPVSMPHNFPGEAFYWLGEALMLDATPNNGTAIITMGLEAAFANDEPIDGEQIVFGRIRIRVDNLVEGGTYTVTHPYGVDVFANIGPDAGPGAAKGPGISYVEDIGIGALGDFSGAMTSRIGPFLTWEPGVATPPGFIGDGGLSANRVVGSPYGTNFFRIEGPNVGAPGSEFLCADPTLGPDPVAVTDCIETDLFILLGKVATHFGVAADSVTYSRGADGSGSVDMFIRSGEAQNIVAEGYGIGTVSLNADVNGRYFARAAFDGVLPSQVYVTNYSDDPPAQVAALVVDAVTVTQADYNPQTQELTVTAYSSDEFALPELTAEGFGPLPLLGSTRVRQAVFTGVAVPPTAVTVVSAAGGSDTEPVSVLFVNQPPTANDDVGFLNLALGDTAITVDILANDVDVDGMIDPATVSATLPMSGTLVIDPLTGMATYTPTVGFIGQDGFTYTVSDNEGAVSNVASVALFVENNANTPPTPGDDTAVTDEDTALVIAAIDLLANDTDADGDTVTIQSVDAVSANNGTIADNLDGTYTYTPAQNFFGSDTFTYTVTDGRGESAVATVTITVNPIDDAPIATADFFSTPQHTPITITLASLLANDIDVDGDTLTVTHVDTYSAEALEQIAEGKNPPPIVDNGDGTITYTPATAIFFGPDTFNYTISDGVGPDVSGVVTIDVIANDVITIRSAEFRGGEWRIRGSGSVEGNLITVYLGTGTDGPIIGVVLVDVFRDWRITIKDSPVAPNGETTITAVSSGGGRVEGFPIRIR